MNKFAHLVLAAGLALGVSLSAANAQQPAPLKPGSPAAIATAKEILAMKNVSAMYAADTEMIEWVCQENAAKPIQHWVGKASDERQGEVRVAPEVLATYVGTFVEQPKLWRNVARVVEISVYEGELYGDMDGRGKTPLIGMSEKEFSGLYGLGVEFTKNGTAPVEQLFVKHVSGNYRFTRKK